MTQSKLSERSPSIRVVTGLALGTAVAVIGLSACSGKDSDEQTTTPAAASAPATVPAPSGAPAAATVPGAKAPAAKTKQNDGDD